MIGYEVWHHDYLDEFAVRLENGQVTGVCPVSIHFAADPDGRLPELEYDANPAALFRFQEYPEQFCLFDPWVSGRRVPVLR